MLNAVDDLLPDLIALRRDLHAHPELAFEERRTAGIVASAFGCSGSKCTTASPAPAWSARCATAAAHAASVCAPTWMRCRWSSHRQTPHASRHAGVHHGCGHDGHTAMLLGAARQLARTRRFDGTVHFIFQPAEEGRGGAGVMIERGPVRALSVRRGLCLAQLARVAARPRADARRARSWPLPIASTSCCAAAAATRRSRIARPTCCSRRASS